MTESETFQLFNTMRMTLSDDELRTAISILCDERTLRQTVKSNKNRYLLKIGDKVEWSGRRGPSTGVVTKVKQKKALVTEDTQSGRWDIPMSMLTKIS
jgi:hypothetical protein